MVSFQVVKLLKPIVAASSHVVGAKNVDKGENFFAFTQPAFSDGTESLTQCVRASKVEEKRSEAGVSLHSSPN